MSKPEITNTVLLAVREFNAMRGERLKITEDWNAPLFGVGGSLDSHGLVNLVVCLEEKVEDELGKSIAIASERAMSQKQSPFRNLAALADFIHQLVQEAP